MSIELSRRDFIGTCSAAACSVSLGMAVVIAERFASSPSHSQAWAGSDWLRLPRVWDSAELT